MKSILIINIYGPESLVFAYFDLIYVHACPSTNILKIQPEASDSQIFQPRQNYRTETMHNRVLVQPVKPAGPIWFLKH